MTTLRAKGKHTTINIRSVQHDCNRL